MGTLFSIQCDIHGSYAGTIKNSCECKNINLQMCKFTKSKCSFFVIFRQS